MKKRMTAVVCLILVLSMAACTPAGTENGENNNPQQSENIGGGTPNADPSSKDLYVWTFSGDGTIMGLSEAGMEMSELVIPADCTGIYGIKSEKLQSVSFASDDTVLLTDVFNGCTALKTVSLPANITEIPDRTFNGCSALEEIVIPNNVVKIGTNAFWDCSSLKRVTMV